MAALALFQVREEYVASLEKVMEMELDDTTLADTLEGLPGDFELKATNCAMFFRNRDAVVVAMKDAAKTLAARIKTEEGKNDRFLAYIKANMELAGIKKIESPFLTLTIKSNPGAMTVFDEKQVPSFFWKQPPPPPPPGPVLDKEALKEALKSGEEIPGAKLEKGTRLEIK